MAGKQWLALDRALLSNRDQRIFSEHIEHAEDADHNG